MADIEKYMADVKKYAPNCNEAAVGGIVKHLGIALRNRDFIAGVRHRPGRNEACARKLVQEEAWHYR